MQIESITFNLQCTKSALNEKKLEVLIKEFPVVALLGTMQCGNSTLAFYNVIEDLKPSISWVIAPVDEPYFLEKDISVGSIIDFLNWYDETLE